MADELQGGNFTVIEGKDGWLFLDESDSIEIMRLYTDPSYLPTGVVDAWAKALKVRRDYFAERGITYLTLVVPDACLVYPEKLPDSVTMADATPFSLIAAQLDDETLKQCVYPVDALVAARSERETFRPTDSHWTDWGAYVGYRATMDHLAKLRDDIEIVEPDRLSWSTTPSYGALGVVMEDERAETLEVAEVTDSIVAPVRGVMNEVRDGYNLEEQDRPDLPSAIIFRDSFMTNASKYFSQSFRRTSYTSQPNAVLGDLVELEKPDVVIFEISERRMFRAPQDFAAYDFRLMYGDLMMDDDAAVEAELTSRSLLLSGDAAAALKANDEALRSETNARLLLHRSRCYTALGNLPAALEALRAAVLCDPDDGPVRHEFAMSLRANGHVAEALKESQRATALEPGHARHWAAEVGLLIESGDHHDAIDRGRLGLERHPGDPVLRHALGTALVTTGSFDQAVDEARAALAADPGSITSMGLLASALVQSERWAEALTVFDELKALGFELPVNAHWVDLVRKKVAETS